MKRISSFLLVIMMCLFLTSCSFGRRDVDVSGDIETRSYSYDISKLEVKDIVVHTGEETHGSELIIQEGKKNIEIEAQSSVFDNIDVYEKNGVLNIVGNRAIQFLTANIRIIITGYSFKQLSLDTVDASIGDCFSGNDVKLELINSFVNISNISSRSVSAVVSDHSEVNINSIVSKNSSIKVRNYSHVNFNSQIGYLELSLSDFSYCEISGGNVTRLEFLGKDFSTLDSRNGEVYISKIELDDNTTATISVVDRIFGTATNNSSLTCYGLGYIFVEASVDSKIIEMRHYLV